MNERILKNLKKIRPDEDFAASSNYLEDGLLDSFDMVELMQLLEREFDVVIDDMAIETDTFCSIDGIVKLLIASGYENS